MKNMFNVTTFLPHSLLQTTPCIHHNFSTQVFRKRAAQLHYVGSKLRYISWPPLEARKCSVVLKASYRTHTPLVQNYAAKHRLSTRRTSVNHYEFQSITALYSLMMDHIDPKHVRVIFNFMSFKIFIQRRFELLSFT